MKHHTQYIQALRYQISAYLKVGFNQAEIANMIGTHKSTISRELSRNYDLRDYRPIEAQPKALAR